MGSVDEWPADLDSYLLVLQDKTTGRTARLIRYDENRPITFAVNKMLGTLLPIPTQRPPTSFPNSTPPKKKHILVCLSPEDDCNVARNGLH